MGKKHLQLKTKEVWGLPYIALIGKWWWRFKLSNNSMWAEVIKSIYGSDGGFHWPSVAKRRSGCWGSIDNIPKDLEKDNVPFLEHFTEVPNNDGLSRWGWSLDPSGKYTVSSLGSFINKSTLPQSDGKWAWNSIVPGKLNILVWLICHRKLPTMANLSKIGINQSNICRLCNEALETEHHIFVECPTSKGVEDQL